ncbi:MAG TPA: hypothetical protein VG389_05715 [Myxococcota bacterium]|jgi:hypothetical protein|nr:hypothetical protein [Myxococcota bacterium]
MSGNAAARRPPDPARREAEPRCTRAAVAAAIGAACAVLGAASPAAPPAGTGPTSPPAAVVFYFEGKAPCRWRLYDPVSGEKRSLHETPVCPRALLFDAGARQSVWVDPTGDTWALTWGTRAVTPLGKLPAEATASDWPLEPVLWTDPGTRTLHAAYMVMLPDEADVVRGGKTYVRFRGKDFPTPWEAGDGSPGMVVLLTQAGSAWKEVELEPTRCEAGDTPCLSVLHDRLGYPGTAPTVGALLREATCADPPACSLERLPVAARKRVAVLFPPEDYPEDAPLGVGYVPLDSRAGILFGTFFGDTLHGTGPAYLCRKECKEHVPVWPAPPVGEEFKDELSVSVRAGFALLTVGFTGARPVVVRPGKKPLLERLKDGHSAVWLSLADLWATAR